VSIRSLVRAQGAYYAATGVWAVADRRSFELVTGRKTDYWLVRTVGVLAAAIGATLLVAARDDHPSAEALVLAVGAGASFTLVDLVYVARRRIGPVYLGDAALHVALAFAAVAARRRAREAPPTETR
jgi:ABC-type cobalamin transport system permease subunit